MISIYFLLISLTLINAHSWLACTNYNTLDTNYLTFGNFNRSKCLGYPRGYSTQFAEEEINGWGVDTGYDWSYNTCRIQFSNNDYSDITPMAIYYSGETIHLSHPAKNHVADSCSNAYIPSESMKVKMSMQSKSDSFDTELTLIGNDHTNGQIDHLGYQNCFNFCANMDKAHCITSWKLPEITTPGRYSFIWIWEFNKNQFFSTCFDAMIILQPIINNSTNSTNSSNTTNEPTPAITVPTITYSPTPTPIDAPTTDTPTTKLPITSNANSLKFSISEIFKSIIITINATINISILS